MNLPRRIKGEGVGEKKENSGEKTEEWGGGEIRILSPLYACCAG